MTDSTLVTIGISYLISYFIISLVSIIVLIIVLNKFFKLSRDVRSITEQLILNKQLINDINFIKQRFDGEQTYLTEDRTIGEIQFLIANGYNDEAKRMLLRKVWKLRIENPYRDIKKEFEHYFTELEMEFPDDNVFKKKCTGFYKMN